MTDTYSLRHRIANVAGLLNEHYGVLTQQPPTADDDFTAAILDTVYKTLPNDEQADYPSTLQAFMVLHHDDLVSLLKDYGPGSAVARLNGYQLASSPAVIAVCERLTVKPLWLHSVWQESWESDTPLEDLSAAWAA